MEQDYRLQSDAELFAAFRKTQREKEEAFRELYSRYAQKIYMYCLRMTGDPNDADDIFQETFTRLFRQAETDLEISNVLAYLLRSARNHFLNSKRSSGRWSPFDENVVAARVPLYEREELLNIVSSALELLDTPYREAFILRFYEGLSYKEMSAITGDTVSSLKVRVMRAKDRLRNILSPYISDLSKQ